MPVNEALLHNWFYGNYDVRVAAALVFAFLFGSIPVGPVTTWLFADFKARVRLAAATAVPPINLLKGFVPTAIAAHGGGLIVGLGAALAVTLGHYYSPWRRFRGGRRVDVIGGALLALSPPSALVFFCFWLVSALSSGSPATGTLFASALLFLPLWFFLGAPGALLGIAAGTALALRLWIGSQALEGFQIENFDRAGTAPRDQTAFL